MNKRKVSFVIMLFIFGIMSNSFIFGELTEVLANAETIYNHAIKIPGIIDNLKKQAKVLIEEAKCLPKPGSPACKAIGCGDRKNCAGVTIHDSIKFLQPSTNLLIGYKEKNQYHPGSIYAILDTLTKLINTIQGVSAKFKTGTVGDNLTKLNSKVGLVNKKIIDLASGLNAVYDVLGGLAFVLNPEKSIEIKDVELPPVVVAETGSDDKFDFSELKID